MVRPKIAITPECVLNNITGSTGVPCTYQRSMVSYNYIYNHENAVKKNKRHPRTIYKVDGARNQELKTFIAGKNLRYLGPVYPARMAREMVCTEKIIHQLKPY